jgi:hypothetical protein
MTRNCSGDRMVCHSESGLALDPATYSATMKEETKVNANSTGSGSASLPCPRRMYKRADGELDPLLDMLAGGVAKALAIKSEAGVGWVRRAIRLLVARRSLLVAEVVVGAADLKRLKKETRRVLG